MSRTDHADYSGAEFTTDKPWHYRSATGWGNTRKLHKALKRANSKANRRAAIPRTRMSGYGYGVSNYKLWND